MKALTVLQPWASLIVHGSKRVENRTWRQPKLAFVHAAQASLRQTHRHFTRYRGPLAIHAGLSREHMCDLDDMLARDLPPGHECPFGAILGTAWLVNAVRHDDQAVYDNEWAYGPWCWILGDVQPLPEPIPYKGARGLWTIDDLAILQALQRTKTP